jgi:hypothetical protein
LRCVFPCIEAQKSLSSTKGKVKLDRQSVVGQFGGAGIANSRFPLGMTERKATTMAS